MRNEVILVFNDAGDFYDVYPKISRSLRDMRDKILGVKGIKWEWHFVLTFNQKSLDDVIKNNMLTGEILEGFLRRTRSIHRTDRKVFWKYEQGRKKGRPHFHLLFDFKKKFNKEYVLDKLYPKGWKAGIIDVKRLIGHLRQKYIEYQRKNKLSGDATDVELLMGLLLRRKWRNGYVFTRQIRGLGSEHRENLIYYINKDLMKGTGGVKAIVKGDKWKFGKGYKFVIEPMFSFESRVSVNRCIHKMLITKENYIKYYDNKDKNGFQLLMRKIRRIKKGEFFKLLY